MRPNVNGAKMVCVHQTYLLRISWPQNVVSSVMETEQRTLKSHKCSRILSEADDQMQIHAKIGGILYDHGRKLGTYYPGL